MIEDCEHGLGCLLEEASYKPTRNAAEKLNVPILRQNCAYLALAMAKLGFGDKAAVRHLRFAIRQRDIWLDNL